MCLNLVYINGIMQGDITLVARFMHRNGTRDSNALRLKLGRVLERAHLCMNARIGLNAP